MNPNKETDRNRLFRAMEWSYAQLAPFRSLVHALVTEYAGSAYGRPGTTRPKYEVLVNLMNQTVDAYTMSLVANRPRVSISTKRHELTYFARQFEVALNSLVCEIQLEQTLRRAVLDAFFCMGIVKMHLRESPQVRIEEDVVINPAMPFASNVSIDNWVHDMAARNYSSVQYAGDWYRIPFVDLKLDIFEQAVVKELELKPTSKWNFGDQDERLDRIAAGEQTDSDELEPMIDVCDIWIPRDKTIYTFPIDPRKPFSGATKAIAALSWENPQAGPYPMLSFNDVPENVVPSSPASHLSGMARIINNLARKQARKAHGQKDIFTYTPAGASDMERINKSGDQQSIAVQEQSEVSVMKMGGVDQALQAYMLGMLQLYDRMAGNLTAMMGLGTQAPTLGQEEMIQGAVSKKEAAMQYRVTDFSVAIVRHLGYMLWQDRSMTIPGQITLPGLEDFEPIDATWTPDDRDGGFFDYDLDIEVHSMPYQSPGKKFQTMLTLVQNVFVPATPAIVEAGGKIDYQKIAEIAAELLDLPELAEIIKFGATPTGGGGGGEEDQSRMPSATSREYVRRSESGGPSPEGQSMMDQQAWLGQGQGQGGQPSPQTVGGQ